MFSLNKLCLCSIFSLHIKCYEKIINMYQNYKCTMCIETVKHDRISLQSYLKLHNKHCEKSNIMDIKEF